MRSYNHNAETIVEACFGKRGVKVSELSYEDMVRLICMLVVVKFFEEIDGVAEIVMDALLNEFGIDTKSEVVELLERFCLKLVSQDRETAEKVMQVLVEYVIQKVGVSSEKHVVQ